jgi:hypothetical protein
MADGGAPRARRSFRAFVPSTHGGTMPDSPDSPRIGNEAQYLSALDELEDLMLADPGTPAARCFDELVLLIEDYDARRDGYDLARIKRALATED